MKKFEDLSPLHRTIMLADSAWQILVAAHLLDLFFCTSALSPLVVCGACYDNQCRSPV